MLYGHDDRSVPFQQTADLVEKLRAQKNVVFEEPIPISKTLAAKLKCLPM